VEAHELHDPSATEAIAVAGETARRVVANVGRVIHAPEGMIERCMLALLCEGHIILEDFPGVGKTMLAKSLARSLDCEFARIQATPDLLPSDITGVNVFNLQTNEFEFRPGPVFANLVLVDEINRASPKTQSALLESMQEVQVTVDGVTHPLARPFMVMATQNPIEYEGTFPLPEAQLDRFTMRLHLGYPSLSDEAQMLSEHAADEPLETLEPVASAAELEAAIAAIKGVYVEESLNRYVVAVLRQTRGDARLALGASPRAGISLLRVAKAFAAMRGREYVIPADVKTVAADVLSHRMILAADARSGGLDAAELIREAVDRTPVPV
jgi:MoxR-like ATPase